MHPTESLSINEYFYTIQGEGLYTGQPSVFVRFNGCNLACWFCDTWYASYAKEPTKSVPMDDVLDLYTSKRARHLVITGGEPTIHPEQLMSLTTAIKKLNPNSIITMETNGLEYVPNLMVDLLSISPKMQNSAFPKKDDVVIDKWEPKHGERHLKKLQENLQGAVRWCRHTYYHPLWLREINSQVQLKFVITSGDSFLSQIYEIDKWIKNFIGVDDYKEYDSSYKSGIQVFLMPEGTSSNQLDRISQEIVEMCKERGWGFSDRLHVRIWGNERAR